MDKNNPILLFSMTIFLNETNKQKLNIYSDCIPEKVAYHFSLKHNLDYSSLNLLIIQIRIALENYADLQRKQLAQMQIKEAQSKLKFVKKEITTKTIQGKCSRNNNRSHHHLQSLTQMSFRTRPLQSGMGNQSQINKSHSQKKQPCYSNKNASSYKHIPTSQSPSSSSLLALASSPCHNITFRNGNGKDNGSIYTRCIQYHNKTQSKLTQLKEQLDTSLDENLSFKPSINPISSKAQENRINNKLNYNHYEQTSNYKTYLEEKMKKLRDNHKDPHTFHPKINHYLPSTRTTSISQRNTSNTNKPANKITKQSHHHDKHSSKNIQATPPKDNQKLSSICLEYMNHCSFRPKITQYQKTGNNTTNSKSHLFSQSSIYNRMYNYSQVYKDKRQQRDMINHSQSESYHNELKTCPYSTIIYEEKKEEALKAIFHLLDSDQDGIISSVYVNKQRLSKDVLMIITPILHELNNQKETLNEGEFLVIINKLFGMLSYDEKKILLSVSDSNRSHSEKRRIGLSKRDYCKNSFTFQPVINKKSVRIVQLKKYNFR